MTLHGKIQVNDITVGAWEATRAETIMNNTHRYNCNLWYRNNEGYPLHAEFTVVGYGPGGAVRLAAVVIATGMKKLKGYPPGQPVAFPF